MPDSITTPGPGQFYLSVMVEYRKTPANRWQEGRWQVTAAVAGDLPGSDDAGGRQLHAATRGQQYLWTGVPVKLFRDDAENYYYNLVSENPRIFIVCSQSAGGPLQPVLATLSYGEAASHMETEDARVESVAMPPELYRWAERFVLEHFVPTKRKKRKRDDWKEAGHGPHR